MVSKAEKQRRKALVQQKAEQQLDAIASGLSVAERAVVDAYFAAMRDRVRPASIASPRDLDSVPDPFSS